MRSIRGGDRATLQEELIDADEADDVTPPDSLRWPRRAAHHEHCALDIGEKQVFFFARDVVWALNANFR